MAIVLHRDARQTHLDGADIKFVTEDGHEVAPTDTLLQLGLEAGEQWTIFVKPHASSSNFQFYAIYGELRAQGLVM